MSIKRTAVVNEHLSNIQEAFEFFQDLLSQREEKIQSASEKWLESEKGEEFSQDTSTLDDIINSIESIADEIDNLFEND